MDLKETFSSLKTRNFRYYFVGQAISTTGTHMQVVAQSWLVLMLTNSGTALGLVLALQYLPILFLSPLGGLIADRYPKRKLLYITQAVSFGLALILGVVVAFGWVRLWMVYSLAFCLGLVNSLDNPTRQTFVIEMVGKDELRNAITLNSSAFNLSRVIGPAIAGVIIATLGLSLCFFLNALSFIAVIFALYMMHQEELTVAPIAVSRKGQLKEGLRYIRSNPLILNILIMVGIIGTLTYEFQVSLPLLAQFTFHGDARTYAALTSSFGLGAVIGGLLTANSKKASMNMLIGIAAMFGAVVIIVSIAPTLILAMALLVLAGIISIALTSLANTLIQLNCTPEMRGRVMSFWTMAFLGSTTVGGPIIGWIGQNISPRWSLAVGGFSAIAAAGIGFMIMRNYKTEKSQKATALEN